jgi:hypothetical protein
MGLNRQFGAGMLLGIALCACAGTKFPYKIYSLNAASYEGTLLGPEPKDDIPLTDCLPTATDTVKCLVVKQEEYEKLKQEYLTLVDELEACQRDSSFSP